MGVNLALPYPTFLSWKIPGEEPLRPHLIGFNHVESKLGCPALFPLNTPPAHAMLLHKKGHVEVNYRRKRQQFFYEEIFNSESRTVSSHTHTR